MIAALAGLATIGALVFVVMDAYGVGPYAEPTRVVIEGTPSPPEAPQDCPDPWKHPASPATVLIYVRATEQECWTQNLSPVRPGVRVRYEIAYKNTSNGVQRNVVVRINRPLKMLLVPGSAYLKNSNHPSGVKISSDNIDRGGIVIGDYAPGAAAYVALNLSTPGAADIRCGWTRFTAVGVAHPEHLNEFYNNAVVRVYNDC